MKSDNVKQHKELETDAITQHYFEVLRTLIAKKSIFAQKVGLVDVASYLKEVFTLAGADVILDKSQEAPFVMAQFKSSRPDAKTLIFYNHYDTVPADNDQPWTSDPFTLTIRDGYMYGRGVDDDKGHITARLTAVKQYLDQYGQLPVNVIFIMEGAEESASVGLDQYLKAYSKDLVGADLLIWEQGIFDDKGRMELSGGTKGIVTFNLEVTSAAVDIHSKFGAVIDSASWYLLKAIDSLRDDSGRILVEGLYEQVLPPNQRERELVAYYDHLDAFALKERYDLQLPLLTDDRQTLLDRLYFEPSLSIEGLSTGYQGQGVKTILPSQALAKMEVRLVPGMDPQQTLDQIERQLHKNGYKHIRLTYTLGEKAYRSDMSAPAICRVIALAEQFSKKGISVLPTTPGTGPMHQVVEALAVPIVAFGIGNPNSRDHGGDENVKLEDYYTHIEMIEELIRCYE